MDFEKTYSCDQAVFVNENLVGFVDGHPSNVDYYREERGYNCGDSDEAVADQYHKNFCDKCE